MTVKKSLAVMGVSALAVLGAQLTGLTAASAAPADPSVAAPSQCESPETQPTSTNLGQRGWVLRHDAQYVPGGIQLTSAGGADGHGGVISKVVSFPLADAAILAHDLTVSSGGGSSFAIQMDTDTGATVVYEPLYSDQLWTDTAGILPRNNPAPGNNNGQGGPYSGSLSDLESNPTVIEVWIGIWNTDEVAVLHSVSFNCETQPFDYLKTPIGFDQTRLFGSTVAGGTATASWSLTSGPSGQSVSNGRMSISVIRATAAELSSCTVSVNGGPATPVAIAYNPMIDGAPSTGAIIYNVSDLVIETGTSLTTALTCQTTAGAETGDYYVTANFTDCNPIVQADAVVAVQPCTLSTVVDVLSITAPQVAPTTPVVSTTPSAGAVLAATGPARASSGLLLGLIALLGGMALVGIGAVRRTGLTREH